VGTADKVKAAIKKNFAGEFDVVSNPEFLREGVAVEDFMKPDRVVIGAESARAREVMNELYAPYVRQGNPVLFMDTRSAELTKYAANSFLATKISFMNEISRLCELLGADVDMVRKGIGSDDRIGKRFLFPGIGYGGSCFPKDVKALIHSASEVQYPFEILNAVEKVNAAQKRLLVDKIRKEYGMALQGKTAAIWGLAFKPNTDDIREAPALEIIAELRAQGVSVNAYDPEAMPNVKALLGDDVRFCENPYEAVQGADFLIIATEWPEFRTPDFAKLGAALKAKVIFDGRNVFETETMRKHGYRYLSIGREDITPV
ncbi:MAG: UDP-glucose/GDP-mannose dehydrogenase family protein, partial [Bacteroidetes bacterium]|nr:UDP-glucose/GDP-mannose dehydrogenase family protein [Bacteroidota bacterium]